MTRCTAGRSENEATGRKVGAEGISERNAESGFTFSPVTTTWLSSFWLGGTESSLQHFPPMCAHGISPLVWVIMPAHTRDAESTRPVMGHAQSICGSNVTTIAASANQANGSRYQPRIRLLKTVEYICVPITSCRSARRRPHACAQSLWLLRP